MSRAIVKIKDKYLEWSSIVDGPVTHTMTLEEFKDYYEREYGRRGMKRLTEDLKRVEKVGNSTRRFKTDELIRGNRAGRGDEELTIDEIYEQYSESYEEPEDDDI